MEAKTSKVIKRRQPNDIKLIRSLMKHWPLPHGKGILLRIFRPRLRNRTFLLDVEPGILISAELDDYMILWCFLGEHEKDPAFQLSQSLVGPGDTVIDVGANVGLWVLGAARRTGPTGVSHAFEPVPDNFERLLTNLKLNNLQDRVRCMPSGLSDECGPAIIYASSNGNSGGAALAQRVGVDTAIEITLTTLDQYCGDQKIKRVDFVKVDVEGAEILVFRGSASLLASPEAPAIVFEVSDKLAATFNSSSKMVKDLLHQRGYDIFRYDGKKLEKVPLGENHHYEDLFAFKPYHFERYPILNQLFRS
jgi:FkbM family methyltransferase